MVRFGAFKINGEKQKFHPSGESIRPAILRRFWGRHITYGDLEKLRFSFKIKARMEIFPQAYS